MNRTLSKTIEDWKNWRGKKKSSFSSVLVMHPLLRVKLIELFRKEIKLLMKEQRI